MAQSTPNPKADAWINNAPKWRPEFTELRRIILGCRLSETLKWGVPCYTLEGKNVVLMHGFKEYCAILFFKGALLKDTRGILVRQTENVQASRQIRFTDVRQIAALEPVLSAYIREAIDIEKSGLEVTFKTDAECTVPEELQNKFDEMPALKPAFEALTPGRKRAYILYFSQPKQSKTRVSRIEKCVPNIFDGKGLRE